MTRSKEVAVLMKRNQSWDNVKKKWVYEDVPSGTVRVLARAEGYAMVRRKGGATTCVPEKMLVTL